MRIVLNDIKFFRLYQFVEKQAKGITHLKRMQRLHAIFEIERIERVFEENEKTIEAFQTDGKAVPKTALKSFRWDDPVREVEIDVADADKIQSFLDRKKKDLDSEGPKGFDDADDWRIWLSIFDAFVAMEGYKEASKSVPATPAGNGTPAENDRPTP